MLIKSTKKQLNMVINFVKVCSYLFFYCNVIVDMSIYLLILYIQTHTYMYKKKQCEGN